MSSVACKVEGVTADNAGDIVGGIAGMGSNIFGKFTESTCIAGQTKFIENLEKNETKKESNIKNDKEKHLENQHVKDKTIVMDNNSNDNKDNNDNDSGLETKSKIDLLADFGLSYQIHDAESSENGLSGGSRSSSNSKNDDDSNVNDDNYNYSCSKKDGKRRKYPRPGSIYMKHCINDTTKEKFVEKEQSNEKSYNNTNTNTTMHNHCLSNSAKSDTYHDALMRRFDEILNAPPIPSTTPIQRYYDTSYGQAACIKRPPKSVCLVFVLCSKVTVNVV